jgi:hypothetical protein
MQAGHVTEYTHGEKNAVTRPLSLLSTACSAFSILGIALPKRFTFDTPLAHRKKLVLYHFMPARAAVASS